MRVAAALALSVPCAFLSAGAASAAELRIPFNELAGLVQAVLGSAKLHLHNKPGGLISLTSQSYFEIAGKQTEIPLTPKSFDLFGSKYTYYADNINSDSIKAASSGGAVRVTLNLPAAGITLSGGCVSGECGLTSALPKIVWKSGTVAIDVVPARLGSSMTLQVKSVSIGGAIIPRCDATGNIFTDGACKAGLGYANRTIAKLKPEIAAKLKDTVNTPQMQEQLAANLKKYLTVGQAGELAISEVEHDAKTVTISFHLAAAAGG